MCGIAGLLGPGSREQGTVGAMIAPIAHRGPDDEGVWIDQQAAVALGHRRLSIIDLSSAGHQPMQSANGRFVISFNGEIYNHPQLRKRLEDAGSAPEVGWRGHSDTETLLEAIAAMGLADALSNSIGMFAFALWDREERTLSLVRDRFGEKPLYYGWAGSDFVFGSELKSIRAHHRFDAPIDRRALQLFVQRGYVPAPWSIYRGVFKLPPGCILTVAGTPSRREEPMSVGERTDGLTLERYWSYRQVVESGLGDPIADEAQALEQLEQVLGDAIRDQAIADVPVGAFLSGGIDSSLVVALYQKHSGSPVRTFSIGFEDSRFNEAKHAKAVARFLGTVHDEEYVSPRQAENVIPQLPAMYDEPFADPSQVPTFLVSRFARGEVKVALTGDGGDELFGGYNRHFLGPRLWRSAGRIPAAIRKPAGAALGRLPQGLWRAVSAVVAGQKQANFSEKLQKALRLAGSARNFDDVYRGLLDEWSLEGSPVLGGAGVHDCYAFEIAGAPDAVRGMYCDATAYLTDDVLCKVDRASMAVSLETRVPFLDPRVAEVAARIPIEMKIGGGSGKRILRQLLYRHVPRELVERPKAGFAMPVGEWIKGPLRSWAEDLLDPAIMKAEGYLDPAMVQGRWVDHLDGRRDSTAALWAILMFQAWLRAQREEVRAAA